MPSTNAAFLADIIAHPERDDIRLIFADWLDENGQADRAEFIRDQIARPADSFVNLVRKDPFPLLGLKPGGAKLFHTDPDGSNKEYRTWAWGDDTELGCAVIDLGRDLFYKVERGFIEVVGCELAGWMQYGPTLVRLHPIQRVSVIDKRPYRMTSIPEDQPGWRWWCGDTSDPYFAQRESENLPAELYNHVRCQNVAQPRAWLWATEADAMRALSAGCITWAKLQPVNPSR